MTGPDGIAAARRYADSLGVDRADEAAVIRGALADYRMLADVAAPLADMAIRAAKNPSHGDADRFALAGSMVRDALGVEPAGGVLVTSVGKLRHRVVEGGQAWTVWCGRVWVVAATLFVDDVDPDAGASLVDAPDGLRIIVRRVDHD